MKAVVAASNQEKALVRALSVIVQLRRLIVFSTSFKYSYRSHVADKINIYWGADISGAHVIWILVMTNDAHIVDIVSWEENQ